MALLIDLTPVRFSHAVKSHHISKPIWSNGLSFVAKNNGALVCVVTLNDWL